MWLQVSPLPDCCAALAGLLGGVFATGAVRAATLPEDRAEGIVHIYEGGGVTATGPALLVRKSIADKVSLTGSYYVDAVSNASIDVVTTASPYKERRNEFGMALDYAVRDSLITLGIGASDEPDYATRSVSLDIAQETFGGMTTVNLGFTRADDEVSKTGDSTFSDQATHWQYRVGVTQILTPKWLASVNLEAISDSGYLGNPYRVARVFGAAVPENVPRTRSSRAVKVRAIGDHGPARCGARRVPLLLGQLGHQGPHRRSRLQPLPRRVLPGRRLRALLLADRGAVLQRQRAQPRRPTSRATASCRTSTTSSSAAS